MFALVGLRLTFSSCSVCGSNELFEGCCFSLKLRLEIRELLRDCRDVVFRATDVLRFFHRTAHAAHGCGCSAERRKARLVFDQETTRAKLRQTRSRSAFFDPSPVPLHARPPVPHDAFAPRVARTSARTSVATSQPLHRVARARSAATAHGSRVRSRRDSRQCRAWDFQAIRAADSDRPSSPDLCCHVA